MRRGPRLALQVGLGVAGLALAAFFWLLFAIGDCSPDCQAAGERAVPVALVAVGLGLAAFAVVLGRGLRRALALGLGVAGLFAAVISVVLLVDGERGLHYVVLASGVVGLLGAALAFRARPLPA